MSEENQNSSPQDGENSNQLVGSETGQIEASTEDEDTLRRRIWSQDQHIADLEAEIARLKSSVRQAGGELMNASVEQQREATIEPDDEDDDSSIDILDDLTGLHNKGFVLKNLETALELGEGTVAVSGVDLDQFKTINDTLGHSVGDKMLKLVGQLLNNNLRTGHKPVDPNHVHPKKDFVGRSHPQEQEGERAGGDEFVFIAFLDDKQDLHKQVSIIENRHYRAFDTMLESLSQSEDPEERALGQKLREIGFNMSIGSVLSKPGSVSHELAHEVALGLMHDADKVMMNNKKERKIQALVPYVPVLLGRGLDYAAIEALEPIFRTSGSRIDLDVYKGAFDLHSKNAA